MITEVKLLTVKARFNILYLCIEVINKAIYDFEPYLAKNLQKRFRDFCLAEDLHLQMYSLLYE